MATFPYKGIRSSLFTISAEVKTYLLLYIFSDVEHKPTQAYLGWAHRKLREYESELKTSIYHWFPNYLVDKRPSGYTPPIKEEFDLALPASFAFRTGRRCTELEAASLLLVSWMSDIFEIQTLTPN